MISALILFLQVSSLLHAQTLEPAQRPYAVDPFTDVESCEELGSANLSDYWGNYLLIENLRRVDGRVFRSALPGAYQNNMASMRRALKHLREKLGIEMVLNLDTDSDFAEKSRQVWTSMGGRKEDYVRIPISNLGFIELEKVLEVLQVLNVRAKGRRILVHCSNGSDMTGLAIAAYRVSRGCDPIQAYQEMLGAGAWNKEFLEDYILKQRRQSPVITYWRQRDLSYFVRNIEERTEKFQEWYKMCPGCFVKLIPQRHGPSPTLRFLF